MNSWGKTPLKLMEDTLTKHLTKLLTGDSSRGVFLHASEPSQNSNGFFFFPHHILSSQLDFQHNWYGLRFSKYEPQSSMLVKRFHNIFLRCAQNKSPGRIPFLKNGLQATRRWRNHICKSETRHSNYVERVFFSMHNALLVSARTVGTNVWPCSICSWNCNSQISITQDF